MSELPLFYDVKVIFLNLLGIYVYCTQYVYVLIVYIFVCTYNGGKEVSCWSSSEVRSSFKTSPESRESGVADLDLVPVLDV